MSSSNNFKTFSLLDNPVSVCNSLFDFIGRSWDYEIVEKFIDPSISTSARGDEIIYPRSISDLEEKVYSFVNNMQ